VQVNDQNVARTAPKTTTEPFTDKLGTGTQVVEIWGDSIRMTRRLRLYDDLRVITISANMTNTSDRDVSLGAASLVDVSDAAKGGWELKKPRTLEFDTQPVAGGVGMTNPGGATWPTLPTAYTHYSLWLDGELFCVGALDPVSAETSISFKPGDINLTLTA
jgi:hypothetical protein